MKRAAVSLLAVTVVGCLDFPSGLQTCVAAGRCGAVDAGGGGGSAGGGAGIDGGLDAGYTYDAFCAETANAVCTMDTRCGLTSDLQACLVLLRLTGTDTFCAPDISSAVRRGVARFDPALGAECLNQARSALPCDDLDELLRLPACTGATVGTQPDGTPCVDHADCVPASFCDASARVCPGQCRPRLPVNATALDVRECAANLRLIGGLCQVPRGLDASCTSYYDCADGLMCDPAMLTCRPWFAVGSPCLTNLQCSLNLRCAGTCVPTRALGQQCTYRLPGTLLVETQCALGLRCSAAQPGDLGVCIGLSGARGPCLNTTECADNLYCTGSQRDGGTITFGRCEARLDAGSPCAPLGSVFQCQTGNWCSGAAVCVRNGEPGDNCAGPAGVCRTGAYCDAGTCTLTCLGQRG